MQCVFDLSLADEEMTTSKKPPSAADIPAIHAGFGLKEYLAIIFSVVSSIVVAVSSFYGLVHSDISDLRKDINAIAQRETKLESAVKILADKEGGSTRSLVDDVLAEVRIRNSLGDEHTTVRLLADLQGVLQSMALPKDSIIPAAKTLADLRDSPNHAVSQAAFNNLVVLANQSSAITPIPEEFQKMRPVNSLIADEISMMNGHLFIKGAYLSGHAIDNSGGHGFDIDGATLENVVLQNVQIVYRGEPVTLKNVRFVNCQIQMLPTPRSDRLLFAIIQQDSSVTIS